MREDVELQTERGNQTSGTVDNPPFDYLVERYYRPLYQFAFSLTRCEADAADLTQHTFHTWQTKGRQLRDLSKVRCWLFTTLHRAFLQAKRRETRFPHFELGQVDRELPTVPHEELNRLDAADALGALGKVDEVFRTPLTLFYLEDCPYKEIAQTLDVPLGTVKSRIARGIAQMKALLTSSDRFQEAAA
jgi:RNA polymerase sigma-70 factor (ECF subfamily)